MLSENQKISRSFNIYLEGKLSWSGLMIIIDRGELNSAFALRTRLARCQLAVFGFGNVKNSLFGVPFAVFLKKG